MKAQHGLTLIELLVIAAILAITSGLAAYFLTSALESARAGAARSDLLSSLALASGRATVAGSRAVLCPSVNSIECSDDPDWSRGWLVFLDANASRELERGEVVVRKHGALPGRVRLRTTAGRARIVFQASGGNAGSNVTFTLCDGRGRAMARSLVLANDGRLRDGAPTASNLAATCVD
jgi:type IV fimbrial biogenesis protein FimT